MASHLAVFDLDETLVAGDSMSRWHQYLADKGFADSSFVTRDIEYMHDYTAGTLNLDDYLAFSLSPLSTHSYKDVKTLASHCVKSRMLQHVFPQARERIAELKKEKATVVIISASLSFLVIPLAKQLGADFAMGIDLVVENDHFQPVTDGIPTFREGKVQRLAQWIAAQPHDFDHVSFYTDSINDLPMCLFADEVLVVNPCPQLFKKAGEYQWPVLRWGR